MNYRDLHHLNNWTIVMFNDTIKTLKFLEQEQGQIRDFVLQTRYTVDTILAAQGGVCAVVHSHCCMYITDYAPNITATVKHMEEMVKNNPFSESDLSVPNLWSMLWSWLPDGSWVRSIVMGIILDNCDFDNSVLLFAVSPKPLLSLYTSERSNIGRKERSVIFGRICSEASVPL